MGGEAAAGGSGIVILRGTQDDLLPVFFNGVQLSEIWLNGVKAGGLIRDGVRVFTKEDEGVFRVNGMQIMMTAGDTGLLAVIPDEEGYVPTAEDRAVFTVQGEAGAAR